jgi:hypothetical protein
MTHDWYGKAGVRELDCADASEDYLPTAHDELVEAVLNGETARAQELVAAGADINALEVDEYPPLCMAVDQMEVNEVRRLLAFGADPNIADPEERKTPLKLAKRLYKEMGFAPTRRSDPLLDAMLALARQESGRQSSEVKSRLEEIISLLESAGGR